MQTLSGKVSALKTRIDADLRDPIVPQLSTQISEMRNEISTLKTRIDAGLRDPIVQQLSTKISEMQTEVSTLKTRIDAELRDPIVPQLSTKVDELQTEVSNLKAQLDAGKLDRIVPSDSTIPPPIVCSPRLNFPRQKVTIKPISPGREGLPRLGGEQPTLPIISKFPGIFSEFREKRFSLLWRGSRHGFSANAFHRQCDGHANTLTVILDTNGNQFGGFTPVKWKSGTWREKADRSLKSFLFTLNNPHNIPPTRFPLKAEMNDQAIWCKSGWGPNFCDIYVSDDCNVNTDSYTQLGISYPNTTGENEETVFTGSKYFQVEEISVFEIMN
jgi:outer membrane murein-binding lipoprotein Lpp